jgi:predicted DNA-binding protein (UPF0251 family)
MKYRQKTPLPGFPWKGEFITKKEIDDYFSSPEGIQCLLCGRMFGTLNNHLQMIHDTTHEEYRARYGLPWSRGLVSKKVSNRLSEALTKRIENGSFIPKPDHKAAVKRILEGARRKDQPFFKEIKSEMTRRSNQERVKYSHKDYENVLSVMLKRQITLNQACMDKALPAKSRVLNYAEENPKFRKKMLDTYYALPYAVQARAVMFSPQFYEDLRRLKGKGLSDTEIGERLGISNKTVSIRLKQINLKVVKSE